MLHVMRMLGLDISSSSNTPDSPAGDVVIRAWPRTTTRRHLSPADCRAVLQAAGPRRCFGEPKCTSITTTHSSVAIEM